MTTWLTYSTIGKRKMSELLAFSGEGTVSRNTDPSVWPLDSGRGGMGEAWGRRELEANSCQPLCCTGKIHPTSEYPSRQKSTSRRSSRSLPPPLSLSNALYIFAQAFSCASILLRSLHKEQKPSSAQFWYSEYMISDIGCNWLKKVAYLGYPEIDMLEPVIITAQSLVCFLELSCYFVVVVWWYLLIFQYLQDQFYRLRIVVSPFQTRHSSNEDLRAGPSCLFVSPHQNFFHCKLSPSSAFSLVPELSR